MIYDPNDGAWVIKGGMKIDCDGSPHAYHPDDKSGLDALANGGPRNDPYGYELNPHTGKPYIQGVDAPAEMESSRGFFVSSTICQDRRYPANDPRRYLNSELIPFIVVPGSFRRHVAGIVMACRVVISFGGKTVKAMVGDVGPAFGEASIAAAVALGINADGRTGGVDSGVEYRIYPGQPVPGYELQPA